MKNLVEDLNSLKAGDSSSKSFDNSTTHVTQSSSEKTVSSDSSDKKINQQLSQDKVFSEHNDSIKNTDTTDEKQPFSDSPKIDAFQFMMNSRHKSIGRNSPGRELDLNESTDSAITKQELKIRKNKLESWAQQKGASKRKRQYDEIGQVINNKLEKRERRLKKMLNVDCQSDDEVIIKTKKRRAVIETDSENSNDYIEPKVEKNEPIIKNKRKKRKRLSLNKTESEKSETEEKLSLTPLFKSWKFKIKICMDEHKAEEEEAAKIKDLDKNKKALNNSEMCEQIEESMNKPNLNKEQNEQNIVTPQEGRVLRTRRTKPKHYEDYILSDEEDTPKRKQKEKKNVKVAPVFLKAAPKPKLDPETLEAKRQFLMSGIPSSLKKEMEKQQWNEEIEFDVFPTISHIQQKSSDDNFWNLPKADLKLKTKETEIIEIKPFSKDLLFLEDSNESNYDTNSLNKIKNTKRIIKDIKIQNPDYPVFKIFNSICEKNINKNEDIVKVEPKKITPKRRGRKKKSLDKHEIKQEIIVQSELKNNLSLWTEKYKPKSSSDIIGNHQSVSFLKDWLTNWLKRNLNKKHTTSDSEFDVTDSDSRDSVRSYNNTIILKGPTGCGKTASVYAICNELDFNILEVNASSKRTGKKLLQELQEATQSHQVYKKENLLSFAKEKKEKPSIKMSILLIEDVDLIFEQDDGFSAALSQIITSSKRPIILTTTDTPTCSTIQKIINNNKTLTFVALSSMLTVWLQIVCLVEGFYLDLKSLEDLFSYNKGDVRRTLLQLQLYVSSGGQLRGKEILEINSGNEIKLDEFVDNEEVVYIHKDCLHSFYPIQNYKSFSLPYCNNLEVIWWNLPSLLNFPNSENYKLKLKLLDNCYNSLSLIDIICGKYKFHESLERRWSSKIKNGLGLEENMDCFIDDEFPNEIARFLLSENIKLYRDKNTKSVLQLSVPDNSKRKWRLKVFAAEEKLQEAILPSDCLPRKALVLDYMPCLRSIARSEFQRSISNTKRGNRFYNYLRNLGVSAGESSYNSACDIFKILE